MQKSFNIIISGVGGQGLMTLLRLLSEAAFAGGFDVKTSELHGLSQRGGSVEAHIRFGADKACPVVKPRASTTGVYSPMVPVGKADLIIALEQQEALNGAKFANKDTVFLVNQFQTPTLSKDISLEEIKTALAKVSKKVFFLPASEVCQKELGREVVSGVYLLGYAVANNFLPLKSEQLKQAIQTTMPEKFWEINLKALGLCPAVILSP